MINENPDPSEPSAGREDRVPLLRLEKYLLNELSSEERAGLEREAARDPRLASSLTQMREARSTLDWQALRGRLEPLAPVLVAKRAAPSSIFSGLGKRLDAWFPNPAVPKLAWAGAFGVLLLTLPTVLVPLKSDSGFRAKGHSLAEVVLEIEGSRLAPGQKRNVQAGEILGFSYRSVKPLYTRIWYQEDGGIPSLFDGRSDSSIFWPASSGWSPAPQRIRLEGDWKVQRVIILASPDKFTSEEARRIILGESKPRKPAGLFTYDLVRP
jgi:hypothetical protein